MPGPLTIGSDPIAPPPTHGYALNHFALVVTDITAARRFYGEILGMRHIMTYDVSPTYKITYMGYPRSEFNFQRGEEMHREMRFREGLLELLHASANQEPKTGGRSWGFSHLGIVVPDVKAAENRMKEFGVPILKGLGEDSIAPGSEVAEWWGLDYTHAVAAAAGTKALGWANILLMTDPDRNVVEVQEQE